MTPTTPAVLPTVPPEVLAFAAVAGVTAELPAVVAMTRQVFPNATMSIYVEEDWEIPDDRHIVIETHVLGTSVEQGFQAQHQWSLGLLACCPSTLAHIFRVSLRFGP
jgi:hypothetical protein